MDRDGAFQLAMLQRSVFGRFFGRFIIDYYYERVSRKYRQAIEVIVTAKVR